MDRDRAQQKDFTSQSILNNGAGEYVPHPTSEDAEVQVGPFRRARVVYFGLDRKVPVPSDIPPSQGGSEVAAANVEDTIRVGQVINVHAK